jgi:hypothetical protein
LSAVDAWFCFPSAFPFYFPTFMFRAKKRFRFRSTGPNSFVEFAVFASVGVISGLYIFEPAFKEFWMENQRKLAASGQLQDGTTTTTTSTGSAAPNKPLS